MPRTPDEIREWLDSLPADTPEVAIDAGGICLETPDHTHFLEVGLFPEEDEVPAGPGMRSYLQLQPGHPYSLTFVDPSLGRRTLNAVRFRRVLSDGRYCFATGSQAWYIEPSAILGCEAAA